MQGIELWNVFTFRNGRGVFDNLKDWMQHLQEKCKKSDGIVGIEPTGHFWCNHGSYLEDEGNNELIHHY